MVRYRLNHTFHKRNHLLDPDIENSFGMLQISERLQSLSNNLRVLTLLANTVFSMVTLVYLKVTPEMAQIIRVSVVVSHKFH
jgi:hypothetical protein